MQRWDEMEIYVVRQGDTVTSIAEKFNVSPKRIIADNGLIYPYRLVEGQALLILFPDTVYAVREGDTLTKIASYYNTTPLAIVQNNPELILNQLLRVGQVLTISFRTQRSRSIIINGYAYPYINKSVLLRTLPYLSRLTIFGYGFTENGELIEIDDEPLIRLALQFDVAPIMLLSSLTESGTFSGERASYLFNNINAQNALISKIITKMKEKNYYGLDVDFEFVNPEDAQAYLSFIRNITAQLNEQGFSVNVDLAPKTSAAQRGLLYEAHDYKNLGQAANTVLLMTYEWGYTYGPPMAVAPVNKVREVVDYAVTEIPPEKILMGIPNYGYDWTLPYERGTSMAVSIGNDYAVVVAADNNAEIRFDTTAQTPYFEYRDGRGRPHVVWFEDVRSIKAKYDVIDEYGLAGAGYWNIMRLFVQNWMYVNARYNIEKLR